MKKSIKKIISFGVIISVFIFTAIPSFAQFSDTNGHWASAVIGKWVENGIINGNPDGTYAPEKPVTRAEFSNMLCKLFNYSDKSGAKFSDVSDNAWYADAVSKAAAAGVVAGDNGRFRPTACISRQEAAVMMYRAFNLIVNDIASVGRYADAKDVDSWAKEAVAAVSEKGYMTGRPGGKFAPKANVTRAEAVKMIDNAVQELKSKAGTYTGTIDRNLMVNTKDVTLKNMVINGDLFLAPGIGDGNVTLDNVRVKGRTVVMGGGENSIRLVNTSLAGSLVVVKIDGKVRIVAEGSTTVPSVLMNSGAKLAEEKLTGRGFGNVQVMKVAPGQAVTLDGDFEEVVLAAAGAALQVAEGSVGKLEVAKGASNASIQIASGATVTTLTADAAVQVGGQGKITTANINAAGVVIVQKPANTNIANGITATIAGTQTTGSTTNTTPASNNNTSEGNTGGNETGASLSSITLTKKGGGTINAAASGSTYTIDLSHENENTFIDGLKVTSSPAADTIIVSDTSNQAAGSNGAFNFTGNKSLFAAFFGTELANSFDGDISVKTIRSIFSGTIKRNVTIKSGNTTIKNIDLAIKISDGDTLGTQDILNCYSISADNGTVTAALKAGNETKPVLTGTQFYQLLKDMITVPAGYEFSGVQVGIDNANYTAMTKDSVQVLKDLAAKVGKGANNITLSDLKTAKITVKVTASCPQKADVTVTVLFK